MSAVGLPGPHCDPHFNLAGVCVCPCSDCTARTIIACICLDCPCNGTMDGEHLADYYDERTARRPEGTTRPPGEVPASGPDARSSSGA